MTRDEEIKRDMERRMEAGIESINKGVLQIYSAKTVLGEKLPKHISITIPQHPSTNEIIVTLVEDD